jgi:hypothetical protein
MAVAPRSTLKVLCSCDGGDVDDAQRCLSLAEGQASYPQSRRMLRLIAGSRHDAFAGVMILSEVAERLMMIQDQTPQRAQRSADQAPTSRNATV